MESNTPNLGLLKKDPVADGNDTFSVKLMLNDNWDKLDADSAKKALKAANPIAGNLAALDAAGNPIDSGKKAVDFEAAGAAQNKVNTHNTAANAHSALFAAKLPSSSVVGKDIIVTGTYTGDGAASRSINLGFAPSFVLIIPDVAAVSGDNAKSTMFGLATINNAYYSTQSSRVLGFEVTAAGFKAYYSGDGAYGSPRFNSASVNYTYLAGMRVTV